MSKLNLGQEGKQIFIDCYNNSEIPWNQLNKEITKQLQVKGLISEDVKFTAKFVREIYESKLNMLYKNRPKGPKVTLDVLFGDDQTVKTEVEVEESTVTAVGEEVTYAWDDDTLIDNTENTEEDSSNVEEEVKPNFEF